MQGATGSFKIHVFFCSDDGSVDDQSEIVVETTGLCSLRRFLHQALRARQSSADAQKFCLPDDILRKSAQKVRDMMRIWKRPRWSSHFELIESRKVKEKDLAARLIDSTIFKMNLDQRELFLVLEHKLGDGNWARDAEWACAICTLLNQGYICTKCEVCSTPRKDETFPSNRREQRVAIQPDFDEEERMPDLVPVESPRHQLGVGANRPVPAPQASMERPQYPIARPIATKNARAAGQTMEIDGDDSPMEIEDDAPRGSADAESKQGLGVAWRSATAHVQSRDRLKPDSGTAAKKEAGKKLAALSGDSLENCKARIGSMIDAAEGGVSDLAAILSDLSLRKVAASVREEIAENLEQKLKEVSSKPPAAVGDICDKVMQRFLYGEKNVVYHDCWTAMMWVTGTTLFPSDERRPLATATKLFMKDCLVPIVKHLLVQDVNIGSEEAYQVCTAIKCFVYLTAVEIEQGETRCLEAMAAILNPGKSLYKHIVMYSDKERDPFANVQGRQQPKLARSEYWHSINAFLSIAARRNVYGSIQTLFEQNVHWIGVKATADALSTIYFSRHVLEGDYVAKVCECAIQALEKVDPDELMRQTNGEKEHLATLIKYLARLTNGNESTMLRWMDGVVLKLFRSSNLQQRIFAVEQMVWWSQQISTGTAAEQNGWCDHTLYVRWLRHNNVLEQLFESDRMRVEIFNRSTKLLLYLAHRLSAGDASALATDDLAIIWKSCLQRDHRIVKSVSLLLIALIKELPVETSLPLFGFWAESTNDDVRELVTLMSSFSTNDDNLLVLSRNRVCSVTSQILWGLIMGTKNREAVSASGLASLIKTLCGILNSSETSGNDEILKQRTFCYRKCIANVLHRDKVHISLDILKETVIENSYISTASSRVYVSRLNEINELCVDINKSGPGLFDRREDGHSGKVHVSLLGVILTAIKWSKLDSRVNKKNTLKQLQFLDAVACRSDVKLGKRELYDIWMSLDSQIGRQALFSWLGETKWSKYPELGAFEEEAREYFFIHLLCEKSDFSKMTSESYQCFCEHFVRLNDDHVVTHFDNIEEVSKRNLLGKKYLWNIMLLAPEKVSSKAMKFFLQLFHALKKDKDTERLTIMEEFLRFVNEDTDGSDPAERTRLHRCFRLLQQMVKEDRDSSDGGGVMRSHSETGRGEPLRITVSAAPKNSDGGLPLKAEATKLSATASSGATLDNLDQKGNIEFTIETHTNAVLWEVRKNISLLLAQKSAQLQINSGIPSVIDDEDYKRLKMSVRGNVLNGRNVLLGWTSLEDGDSIDVETVLFDQEKAGKSPIGRSNLRVLSSLKSRSTSPIDLTDYDGSTFRVEDSSTSSQSKFGTKMSNILRNNNDFYNRTIRLVLKAKHSDHGSSWQDRLWGYLVEAPAWEKVAEVIEAKRTWENFYDEIREYPYRAYFVMAMHARLIPANDGDFGQAVSWRRQFVARGGFLFLLDFFMSHTGHETGNMRRCGLSTALKCVKFLVLGAVQATGTGGSSTPSKASSNASKSFISPPRIGKMFEEDAITPLRTFSAETANRIRDTLEEQDFFLKLASISINLHQRESPQNRKKSGGMVVLNALHAMEELIRGMPEMAHSFSELAIKHKIIELAIHSSSELHRKAASAVIKSLWQSFLVLEREQEGTAPILGHTLSCAIQENISSLNGSSNGRYLELSQAVEFHIRQCISGNSQDEKRRNWNLALETLLYTLPNDSSDRDGTVSESRCFDPANGMRKENILSGILSNLVALTSTSDSNVANVGLLRFIVQRCLFYVPKERKDTGRALCRTGKTRALAFHLLNSNSRDSGVREDVFVNIYSLYESLQEQESFLSLPASMRWKYDPSDAELKPHGFCGLTNQGATCYMNSLLQQFFMCDKIREGVLAAEFDEDVQPDNVTSILKELKRAFTFLQNSESKSFNTTAFVESCRPLGLTNDILSQNDTAEFCDKLVDCLEVVLKGTWKVFSGLVMHETDFVGVQYRSEREQPFIFLPLPIVGTPVATLEKSLQEFVKAEKMDGENQVECEEAGNRKFDAFRRDWVSQLPELLIVHLKRWQLDYQTFAMKKINSRCEFPMELDMMPYVKQRGSSSAPRDDEASYKYALSGILVHRGPAGGGHYFSIIKDRASGKWYKFNDETVVEFQAGRIDAASFGRSNGDQSAYMLFYDRLNRSWPGQTGSESRIINKGVVPDSCTSFQARLDTEMSNYNASFIQRQFLYDPELAKFLYNDMNAFDYDIDDKKMALAFFMDVLARSYHTTILAQFVECLVRHLRSDEQLSSWVLKQFCNTSAQDWGGSWLDGLVECSEKSKRHATGRIIRTAVSTCAKAAGKLEQGSDMYGHVNLFCGIFMNMMWKVAKKWRQSTEYFDCLRQIAKQKLCAQLFVETGAIPRLVHYFLGSESTNTDFPPLLSWESASSSWGYATEPPDRTLPLKVLVSLSEYAQGQMLGDVNDTDLLRCGDAFYKYAVDLFDGGTAPFRLIERIASTEGIVLEDLKQKLFIGKLACEGESNSITFGSKEMYTGSMYAIATIFVMNHEVPIDGIVTSARLCITNHRERPSTKASCDYEVCVYEKANRERDPICFDDGTKLTVKYIGKEEVRTFEPGHRVSAMKIDATTGDMGDFENGMIKEVDPESGTYTVYFDDTTVAPNVIGDFISASAAPFPEDRQCFTIVARRSIDVDVRKAEVQEFFDLDMPVKKGQYIGIVNHIDKLWLSWEQQWKSSDEFHFKNWYTTKYTATKKSNSRQEGSTVMNLRMSTSRPQYSVKIVSLAERKKVT